MFHANVHQAVNLGKAKQIIFRRRKKKAGRLEKQLTRNCVNICVKWMN